jgi:predicted transcriptional regulator
MTARVTISLPDDLLAQLDAIASSESLTRSDVVREAAGQYLVSRSSGAEDARRQAAVDDGIAWLRQVAQLPAADARPSLDILRDVRQGSGVGPQGTNGSAGNRGR